MSSDDVDRYLSAVPEPQRTTLEAMRRMLADLLPEAEQGIAYGVPCFKLDGKGVAGFGSYADHCSYLPMSGTVTTTLAAELDGFVWSKGSIQFAVDEPLPAELVARLVETRRQELVNRTH